MAATQRGKKSFHKRILVTGGAGFVGSNLCRRLVEDGHQVLCLDNFYTSQKEAVSELLEKKNFELIRHDVTDPIKLEVDEVYHLACPAAPGHYQFNPLKTLNTSYIGTLNMLELAREQGAKFLQASTSEVYGEPLEHPQTESYHGNVSCTGPRACYDEGKRAAETLCVVYSQMYKVEVRIVRIFNTYGPNMHPYDGRVVSNFVRQALNNEDITIFGDGSQTRSFQFVDDLVNGLILMMNNTENFQGPVNIGNPVETTIGELARKIVELTGSTSQVIRKDLPQDDPTRRCPDISLAKAKLGWEPLVGLDDGLKKTIEYFRGLELDSYRPPTSRF